MLVPRTVEDLEMLRCDAAPDTSSRFEGKCCSTAVHGVQAAFYLSNNANFGRVSLHTTDSHFMFGADRGSESHFLELKDAKIELRA